MKRKRGIKNQYNEIQTETVMLWRVGSRMEFLQFVCRVQMTILPNRRTCEMNVEEREDAAMLLI